MQPLISIVMPVYKVEKYLEKAVRSVMEQCETDWELILVDDASPDESGAMCDRFAAMDSRISVIHLSENGGLSNARNTGMKTAQGRYLMFMDSDDWVEDGLIDTLAAVVRKENAPQMVVWGVTEEHFGADGKMKEERTLFCPAQLAESENEVRKAALGLEKQTLLGYAWNKLYDMGLIRQIGAEFERIPLIEDILFNLSVLGHVSRMQILESTPYHYARRAEGSLTHRFLPYYYELSMRRVETMMGMYDAWGMKDEAAKVCAPIYARYALSALQRNCDPRAAMSFAKRKQFVQNMVGTKLFRDMAPYLRKKRGLGALPGKLIAMGNSLLCLAAGRGIYFLNTKMQGLYVKLIGERQGGKEQ